MVLFSGKQWPRLILAVYLTIAIMGVFTFMVVEPLSVDVFGDGPVSDGLIMPIDHTIDCLAENVSIISKAGGSSSLLRNGHLRILTPFGIKNTGAAFAQSSSDIIEKINYPGIKNSILLKLRI
jgi:hypothetical protein